MVIAPKKSFSEILVVASRSEFAQDHESGIRSDRGAVVQCDVSKFLHNFRATIFLGGAHTETAAMRVHPETWIGQSDGFDEYSEYVPGILKY
jgi:hypothetical protein